jgi:hypothetical protein
MHVSVVKMRETATKFSARGVMVGVASLALLGFIGLMDYITGREISFGVFYFLPIWLVTWYFRRGASVLFSFLCALVWLAVDEAGDAQYSSAFIPFWNAAVRLVYFLTFTFLLTSLREKLRHSRQEIRKLSSLLPICASCKKIRDDQGRWHPLETYISGHSDTDFSHGICPDCARKIYPEFAEELIKKWKRIGG